MREKLLGTCNTQILDTLSFVGISSNPLGYPTVLSLFHLSDHHLMLRRVIEPSQPRLLTRRNYRLFTVLALESSADDTCAAIVNSDGEIVSNVVVKQHS